MAIGKRIKFFRKKKELTQKQLGRILGFLGKTSDVRIAQYEAEARIPKQELVKTMANIFGISPNALTVPNIDNYIGLLHTFFALEDLYGLKITTINDEIYLHLDKSDISLLQMFQAWQEQSAKLEQDEITKQQYDQWRYNYPKFDTFNRWAKVPSQAISDIFTSELDNKSDE